MAIRPLENVEIFDDEVSIDSLLEKLAKQRNLPPMGEPRDYVTRDQPPYSPEYKPPNFVPEFPKPQPHDPAMDAAMESLYGQPQVEPTPMSRQSDGLFPNDSPMYTKPTALPPRVVAPPVPTDIPLDDSNLGVQQPVPGPGAAGGPPTPSPTPQSPATGQPGALPGKPEGEPKPGSPESYRREPNDILRQAYAPAILQQAREARAKDLERGTGLGAMSLGREQLMAGALLRNQALSASGAAILKRAQTEPVNTETLEGQGRAMEALGRGTRVSDDVDKDSDASKGARLALHASPMFDKAAAAIAKTENISLDEAKVKLYNDTKGLSKSGVDAYTEGLKIATETGKVSSETVLTEAKASEVEQMIEKLTLENQTTSASNKAFLDSGSASSFVAGEFVKTILGQDAYDEWRSKGGRALDVKLLFGPEAFNRITELMKSYQDYNNTLKRETQVDERHTVKTQPATSYFGGKLQTRDVPNEEGVRLRQSYSERSRAATNMLGYYNAIKQQQLQMGSTAINVKLGTEQGNALWSNVKKFAEEGAKADPANKAMYDNILNSGSADQTVHGLLFGPEARFDSWGKSLLTVNGDLSNMTHRLYNVNPNVIPDQPPMELKFREVPVKTKVGELAGYKFRIGDNEIVYYQAPGSTIWRKDVKPVKAKE